MSFTPEASSERPASIVWLLATGAISMLGQVVLLRELNVAFYGSELIYVLALGVWLLWTAVGAALGRGSWLPSGSQVRSLLVALAWLLPIAVVFVRGVRRLFGAVPGAYLPFPLQLLAMSVSLLPVGLLLGLLFQWAAKRYVGNGRTLAAAYAIESVGGLAGGTLATALVKWGMQNLTAALVCVAISLAAAVVPRRRRRTRALQVAWGAGAAMLVLAFAWEVELDRHLTAWNHPRLVATRDTPYGRVTVTEASGQISVYENDTLVFDTEETAGEEFVHVAALQHARPRDVLLLGGAAEGLIELLLSHHPDRIDCVELDEAMLTSVILHLPDSIRRSVAADRVRVIHDDPRRHLGPGAAYDLILIGMSAPDSGRTNRFYTREFFASCGARLRPGGVLAARLRGAENLWTSHQIRRASSIYRALRSVFRDVQVLPGATTILLASNDTLGRDPEPLVTRLLARQIDARLVVPPYLRYRYTNDRFLEMAGLLTSSEAPLNTDARPVCYRYTLLIWLSKFFPRLGRLDLPEIAVAEAWRSPWAWLGLLATVGAGALARRRPYLRRALLAGIAGLAGMVLESVLILHYQTTRGVVFQDLGVLLTLFMAGLVLGSAVMDRQARRAGPGRKTGAVLLSGFAGLSLIVAWLPVAGAPGGLPTIGTLLLANGFLVAAVFGYASLYRRPDQRSVVSPVYAADLLGGCVGSLLASLFLIPLLGLSGSALTVVLVVAAAAVLT